MLLRSKTNTLYFFCCRSRSFSVPRRPVKAVPTSSGGIRADSRTTKPQASRSKLPRGPASPPPELHPPSRSSRPVKVPKPISSNPIRRPPPSQSTHISRGEQRQERQPEPAPEYRMQRTQMPLPIVETTAPPRIEKKRANKPDVNKVYICS